MYFAVIDVLRKEGCPVCEGLAVVKEEKEKLVWLCGRDTVNVNPEKPLRITLDRAYELIRRQFKVRVRSPLAVIFNYQDFEISLFNGGRMLIKNVHDEKSALKVYKEVIRKLKAG
jgi:adenylyltransferase/sulfurtransferase